jgi:type I restriction enzyme S subunit
MSKWITRKLGDISEMCLGKMLDEQKNKGEFEPYLANINVRWGGFDLLNLNKMPFEEREQDRYGLKVGDLVICEGGEPGRCAIWSNEVPGMKIQKALHRMRIREDYSSGFVYYRFLLAGRNGELNKHFIGSTIKHLTGIGLKQVEFSFPPLQDQQTIAAVLSALDAKIECNNRINAELEAIAKTLYDYWFVQFDFPDRNGKPYKSSGGKMVYNPTLKREIPEGWECKALSRHLYCNRFKLGKNHKYSNIRYLDTANLTKNIIESIQPFKIGKDNIPSRANMVVKKNDILYSTVRPNQCHYGLIKQPIENMISSTGFALLSHKQDESLNDVFYLFLTSGPNLQRLTKISESSKSSYPSVSPDDILNLDIALPNSNQLIEKACNLTNPIFEKLSVVQKENHHLTRLRDWLLPILMNGQVTVT